ncbi:MAG: metal ABC transporter permease [Planctomycetes bacterium]|nr:metal ABC transporter permease [Planctomycetota bacterium]
MSGVLVWDITPCCLLGVTVGLSLRVSGMLYTFGCLVLPSLAARSFCRNARSVLIAAPITGLFTCAAAFVLANHYDQSPGQTAVAAMCGAAALASLGRMAWRRGSGAGV